MIKSPDLTAAVCPVAEPLYLEEWNRLTRLERFRLPLKNLTPDHINSFNVIALYSEMRSIAPNLLSLFEGMGNKAEGELESRRQCRHIAMAVSVIGNLRSRQINYLQAIMSYFLYSNRVPKRFHHIAPVGSCCQLF